MNWNALFRANEWAHIDQKQPDNGQYVYVQYAGSKLAVYRDGKFYGEPNKNIIEAEMWKPYKRESNGIQ